MPYQGDYAPASIVDFKFTSRGSTGLPTTLAGSPALSVYKSNSTTESTTGVTLTVDFDSRTGCNHVHIDTSADGTFYAGGVDFDVVITTGTVGGVSVVGEVVGGFSLNNRSALRPATAGRTLVVDAAGLADANTVKLGPSGSGTAQTARDVGASVLLDQTQVITSTPVANSIGEAFFATDIMLGRINTAQAGSSTTITLDAGASGTNNRYIGYLCFLYAGTGGGIRGVGQERTIIAYNGATKVATLDTAWGVTPDATSKFMLEVKPSVNVTMWAGDNAGVAVDANHLPKVDVEDYGGAAGTFSGGSPEVNTVRFANQVITASAGVTLPSSVASPTNITSASGIAVSSIGNGVIVVATFGAGAINSTVAPNLDAAVSSVAARLPTALSSNGNIKSDVEELSGNTGGAARLDRSARAIVTGTVGSASTTTSIVTSLLSPAAAVTDQFKGRIVIFDKDTTTANLRGQATDITGSTSGGVLTVTALTTAAASGDTFTIT